MTKIAISFRNLFYDLSKSFAFFSLSPIVNFAIFISAIVSLNWLFLLFIFRNLLWSFEFFIDNALTMQFSLIDKIAIVFCHHLWKFQIFIFSRTSSGSHYLFQISFDEIRDSFPRSFEEIHDLLFTANFGGRGRSFVKDFCMIIWLNSHFFWGGGGSRDYFTKFTKNSKILQKFTKKANFAEVSQKNNVFSQRIMKKNVKFCKKFAENYPNIVQQPQKKCTIYIGRTFHTFRL